jgi:hypothetical protein
VGDVIGPDFVIVVDPTSRVRSVIASRSVHVTESTDAVPADVDAETVLLPLLRFIAAVSDPEETLDEPPG